MPLSEQLVGVPARPTNIGVIGKVVRSLRDTNVRGSVVMRLERCAYLQFNTQLVCVGLNEIGASSITALFNPAVRVLPPSLSVGATAQLSKHCLIIDDQYFFDLLDASTYASILPAPFNSLHATGIHRDLLLQLSMPTAGLAPLLKLFTTASDGSGLPGFSHLASAESELLRLVMPPIARLTDQIQFNCSGIANGTVQCDFDSESFQSLIGAGPGLTPSGDDFLSGVFTALHSHGCADVACSLWRSIRNVVWRSTTQVSAALLEQSALGESSERLDVVMQAYDNYPLTSANELQQSIELIGETSGWDWLTGFVMCGEILWQTPVKTVNYIASSEHKSNC